jgi:hypothetical protein
MRHLFAVVPCVALIACSDPLASRELLDGVWTLESSQSPLDPRVLTLVQHGSTVDGSGNAMGVDAPVPLTVRGAITGSRVVLVFHFTNGSELTAEYSATVFDRRLTGMAVFHDGAGSHPLAYIRH